LGLRTGCEQAADTLFCAGNRADRLDRSLWRHRKNMGCVTDTTPIELEVANNEPLIADLSAIKPVGP
jgi:hypothetical protein